MGTHEHYPHPFPSQENILLNSSEVNIYKKHTRQYESKSRMKPGKEPHAARKPLAGHLLYSITHNGKI